MLKHESNDFLSAENRARPCETCLSTVCTVYCYSDSAYLCTSCDVQVHSSNRVASRHKRVRVCESCECEPAAFLCEADDASLCTACDSEVYSANPLARRHQRVPILPISGNSYKSKATHHHSETTKTNQENILVIDQEPGEKGDEDAREVTYWLFPNSDKISGNHSNNNQSSGLLFSDAEDSNLSMDYKKFTGQYNQQQQDCSIPHTSYGGYRVVPLQFEDSSDHLRHNQQKFHTDITYGSSGSHHSHNGSLNHNAHISSMETGIVPESTARDTTASHQRTHKGIPDQLHDPPIQMTTQLTPMDREARVLRYKEKGRQGNLRRQ